MLLLILKFLLFVYEKSGRHSFPRFLFQAETSQFDQSQKQTSTGMELYFYQNNVDIIFISTRAEIEKKKKVISVKIMLHIDTDMIECIEPYAHTCETFVTSRRR